MKTYTITMNENQVKAIASVQATLQSVDAEYYDAFMSIELPELESEEPKHNQLELFNLVERLGNYVLLNDTEATLPVVTGLVNDKPYTGEIAAVNIDVELGCQLEVFFIDGFWSCIDSLNEEDSQKVVDFVFEHFDDGHTTSRHGDACYDSHDYFLDFDVDDRHFCCTITKEETRTEGKDKIYEFESGNDWIKVVIHGQNDFDVYVNSELETSKRPQKVDGSEVDDFKEITTNGQLDVEKITKKLDHPYIPDGNDPNDPCSLDSYLPLFSIVVHNMFETFEDFYTFTMDAIPDMFNVFKEIYKDSTFNSIDAECFFENFIITILPWIKEQGWSNMQGFNCNYISR